MVSYFIDYNDYKRAINAIIIDDVDLNRVADSIVKYNKVDVDAVSGATNSSNVIKKACENAIFSEE